MGATDNRAAAVAALVGILRSPMVRDPALASILHTYCTGNGAVQPPESDDRRTALIGWDYDPNHLRNCETHSRMISRNGSQTPFNPMCTLRAINRYRVHETSASVHFSSVVCLNLPEECLENV